MSSKRQRVFQQLRNKIPAGSLKEKIVRFDTKTENRNWLSRNLISNGQSKWNDSSSCSTLVDIAGKTCMLHPCMHTLFENHGKYQLHGRLDRTIMKHTKSCKELFAKCKILTKLWRNEKIVGKCTYTLTYQNKLYCLAVEKKGYMSFPPMPFQPLRFQPFTLSTPCLFNRLRNQPPQIRPI